MALSIRHASHIGNEDGPPKTRTDIQLACSDVARLLPVFVSVLPAQPDSAGLGMAFPVVCVWYHLSDWLVPLLVVKHCGYHSVKGQDPAAYRGSFTEV